jgi:hypothetical protein
LETWKLKTVASQIAVRPDLQMLASQPDSVYEAVKQAMDSTRSASNTGTAIHAFTEMIDDGTLDLNLVPEAAKPYVHAYAEAKEKYKWQVVAKEFTIYNHEHGYAGTSDRALLFPDHGVCISDIKSGKDVYADMAIQMGFYAYGEGIWVPPTPEALVSTAALQEALDNELAEGMTKAAHKTRLKELEEHKWKEYARKGQHLPMPADLRQDIAFILHLLPGKCELVALDLTGIDRVIFGISSIYWWKTRKDIVGAPKLLAVDDMKKVAEVTAPVPELEPSSEAPVLPVPSLDQQRESLKQRVIALSAEARQELVFNWPGSVPTFKQSPTHTQEQLQAIEDVLYIVECKFAPPLVESEAQVVEKLTTAFPDSTVESSN